MLILKLGNSRRSLWAEGCENRTAYVLVWHIGGIHVRVDHFAAELRLSGRRLISNNDKSLVIFAFDNDTIPDKKDRPSSGNGLYFAKVTSEQHIRG